MAKTTTTTTTNKGQNTPGAPAPTAEERAAAVTPQEVPVLEDRQARSDEQNTDTIIEHARGERDQARQEVTDLRARLAATERDLREALQERNAARDAADEWKQSADHWAAKAHGVASVAQGMDLTQKLCEHNPVGLCTCAGRVSKCPALSLQVDPDADFKPASPENERYNRALAEAKARRSRRHSERGEAVAAAGNRDDVPTERTARGPRWTEE